MLQVDWYINLDSFRADGKMLTWIPLERPTFSKLWEELEMLRATAQKWGFPLRNSSVNVTKSVVSWAEELCVLSVSNQHLLKKILNLILI